MKNIMDIIVSDFKRLTSSVVPIIIILGICIVPCLFAWFNIFSNWDPFAKESTSHIPIAVVNEDEGVDMMGLYINVGEKAVDALKGNDMIQWTFVDDREEAMKGTLAGDYYAEVVIPKDFSEDVVSFSSGEPENPTLLYYENQKKNAIAAKITDRVKGVLQEEINTTFLGTIAQYITEAQSAADAADLEPEDVFGDLSNTMDDLGDDLGSTITLLESAEGITDAANELMIATGRLASGSEKTLKAGERFLDASEDALPDSKTTRSASKAIKKEANIIAKELDQLYRDLSRITDDMDAFNTYVEEDLQANKEMVSSLRKSAAKVADRLQTMGLTGLADQFSRLAGRLAKIEKDLDTLEKADEETWPVMKKAVEDILSNIKAAAKRAAKIGAESTDRLDKKVNKAIKDASRTIAEVRSALKGMYSDLNTLDEGLLGSEKSLRTLTGGMNETVQTLISMQDGCRRLSELFESLSDSDMLRDVNHLMKTDAQVIAERLAAPIQMDSKDVYPIDNFGSAMAGLYTGLAQWIGALFAAVMMNVQVRRREGMPQMRLHERFFGRYRLFMVVGLLQALIVSLGDILYVGIQCVHPVLFVLAACVNSVVFTLIIYSMVFAMENIGLAVAVILMIFQVSAAGGLFPIELFPRVFQIIHPFMPLTYAIRAIRECIGGMYGLTYFKCLGILVLFAAASVLFGLLAHNPMKKLIRIVEEAKEDSDVML